MAEPSPATGPVTRRSRWRRVAKWTALLLLGVPVGLLALSILVVLIGANTNPGRHLIEREAKSLTGGMVALEEISGRFPQDLHVGRIAVRDAKGAWLTLDGLHIAWSPLALLGRDVSISVLTADRLAIPRLPESSSSQPQPSSAPGGKSSLHMRIVIGTLHVGRIDVGSPVAGVPASLSLDGHMRLEDLADLLNTPSLDALPVTGIGLSLRRLDAPGALDLNLGTPRGRIELALNAHDGPNGFIQTIAHLDALQPATLNLSLHGPLHAAALDFGAQAGPVDARLNGLLDLPANRGRLGVRVHAPAMTPLAGIGWDGFDLDASLAGSVTAPTGHGEMTLKSFAGGGAGVGNLHVIFDGAEGAAAADTLLHLHAVAEGVRLPGASPTLLAGAPLEVDLRLQPRLAAMPLQLDIAHPLLHVAGHADVRPQPAGALTLDLPDLAPLARLGGVALKGHAAVALDFALPKAADGQARAALTGDVAILGGMAQAVGLIGPDGKIALNVTSRVADAGHATSHRETNIERLSVTGQAIALSGTGRLVQGATNALNADLALKLPDLARISPSLRGHADLALSAAGPMDDLGAKLHAETLFGAHGVPEGPLTLDAEFAHLPQHFSGTVQAKGQLDRAPLALDAALAHRDDGTMHLDLKTLSWNSVSGAGALDLPPGAKVPLGDLKVDIRRLADFSALAGQALAGHLAFEEHTQAAATRGSGGGVPVVRLQLDGALSAAQAKIGRIGLRGQVADPAVRPDLDLALDLAGLAVQGVAGDAQATLRGPLSALDIGVRARAAQLAGAPATVDTALRLDLPGKAVAVSRLAASVKGEAIRLLAPARLRFGDEMGVDRLRLTVTPPRGAPASLDLAGSAKPKLDLTARFESITPALARPFAPALDAAGSIDGQARLTGTLERPAGNVSLHARGLQMRQGAAASLPAANIDAQAQLQGETATLNVRADAGKQVALTVQGSVPTARSGSMALRIGGHVDLVMADAILGAQGIATSGQLVIDMGVSGALDAPRASGRVDLRDAMVNDYAQGARLYDINGAILAQGDTLQIQNLQAKAGSGTIAVNGAVGAFRPGMPLDLHIVAAKAQPVASDLLTATINSDLRIHGQAATRIDVDGRVAIPTATINIPNALPASIPQLNVVRPGDKPPEAQDAASRVIGLDIAVVSPGEFFVRGHGLDAVMSGKLHVGGTASEPAIDGGFDLQRGNFNLAGVNLTFTQGRVAFNGSGVSHKLDPTLNFRADRNVEGTLASLLVTGYASAPKIDFQSNPTEPRDQVLAMLLFGTTTAKLSTTQLAELAAAVAQMSGGSSFDPMSKLRNALGLDRLAVGGGGGVNNGGASVEAGKYVMKGVYVGAKQATSGSGTQAQVQVDLTRHLKLNTTVGTGGQVTGFTTPENDPGSSVGLSWGLNY